MHMSYNPNSDHQTKISIARNLVLNHRGYFRYFEAAEEVQFS